MYFPCIHNLTEAQAEHMGQFFIAFLVIYGLLVLNIILQERKKSKVENKKHKK